MNYYRSLILELNLLRENKTDYSILEYEQKLTIIRGKLMSVFIELPLTDKEEKSYVNLLESI